MVTFLLALDTLAPDVDWTNSIGLRIVGRAKMAVFLKRLFADADFRAGQPGPLEIRSVRMLGPDAAVILSSEATVGQKDSSNGKVVPVLHTNELSVLQRQNGHWLIVTDLTSDESHGI